jgi:hypothetical protein
MSTNEKRDHWGKIIAAWRESGQTQRAYCAERGLSYSNFCYWRRVSGRGGNGCSDEGIRAIEITRSPMDSSGSGNAPGPSPTLELDTQGIVLALPGSDATITIVGRMSLGDLGRLMAACAGSTGHAQA